MCVARIRSRKGAILVSPREGATDGPHQPYPTARPNGRGPYRSLLPPRRCLHAAQPRWEALRAAQAALGLGGHRPGPLAAVLQQLRGVESERSFLRDTQRFFSHLFPGVVGLHPSSFHRRVRKLRRFLEPLRRQVVCELGGDPETLLIDSTLLAALHPRQVAQSAGFPGAAWVRWGSFSVYGVKLHLLCATNRAPLSYDLTAATGGG